jgi:hypothetical protein
MWFCTCQCGNTNWVDSTNLRGGISTNCGCNKTYTSPKQQAARSASGKANRTHGMSGTHVYRSWAAMKARCNNPKEVSYPWYGGMGIRVCERWNTFENFLADMGQPPTDKHELERRNNQRDYEPHNCHWIEGKHQPRNRSNTIKVPTGESLAEYCETHQLNYQLMYDYFVRKHLPLTKAVELVRIRS